MMTISGCERIASSATASSFLLTTARAIPRFESARTAAGSSTNASPTASWPPSRRFSQPTSPTTPPQSVSSRSRMMSFGPAHGGRAARPGHRAPPRRTTSRASPTLPAYQRLRVVPPSPATQRDASRTNDVGGRLERLREPEVHRRAVPSPPRMSSIPRPRT